MDPQGFVHFFAAKKVLAHRPLQPAIPSPNRARDPPTESPEGPPEEPPVGSTEGSPDGSPDESPEEP